MISRLGLIVAVLAQHAPALGAQSRARKPDPFEGRVRPEWIEASIRYLSDDLLRGRETGKPGGELAAKYVAAELEAAGLRPLGTFADYLMPVPLRYSTSVAEGTSSALSGPNGDIPLELGTDYLVHPDKQSERAAFEGEVVFVGFGVTVPELGYDDYRDIDVRGKVVAMVFGGPSSVPPDQRGHYAGLAMKERNARDRGAVGVVTLFPAPAALLADKLGQLEGFGWTDSAGAAHSPFFESGVAVRLSDTGIQKLFGAAGRPFAAAVQQLAKGPASFATGVKLSFHGTFRHQTVVAHNAVGMIEGSDPVLKHEYVVYSAHLDHVGVGTPVGGDSVYHGAIDNAGGTAVVAALARAYAGLPRPRRSIIFLAVTGEEKGILGSDYFVHHPPVPIEAIVADVNLDNFVLTGPFTDLVAFGAGYSSLSDVAARVLGRLGIAVSDDPLPAMTIFTRSDHYTFMMAGVPGVMFFPGKASNLEGQRNWFANIHHTPRDRFDQGIDWNAAVKYATVNLMVGSEIANQTARPAWRGPRFFQENRPRP